MLKSFSTGYKNLSVLSVSLYALMSAPSVLASDVDAGTANQCKAVHFYKVENPEHGSSLLLLGANHAVNLKKIPGEVVDEISKSESYFAEIDLTEMDAETYEKHEKETDRKILGYCIEELKAKGLYREGQGLGFMDKHSSNLISAMLNRKKIAAAKVWFDLIKEDLSPEVLHHLDKRAVEIGYADAQAMLQHFHPLVLPMLASLDKDYAYFSEADEGMDFMLAKLFGAQLKKPVYAFEDELDRAKAAFEVEIRPELAALPSNRTFSLLELDKVVEMLSALGQEKNEEEQKLVSIQELVNKLNDLELSSVERDIEANKSLISLAFKRIEVIDSYLIYCSSETKKTELLKEKEEVMQNIAEHEQNLAQAQKKLANFVPRGAFDEEYLSGEIHENLNVNNPQTTVAVRNNYWLPKIVDLLNKDGSTVSASVGVGHLYGKYGLLNLLSAYKISRWSLQTHGFEVIK